MFEQLFSFYLAIFLVFFLPGYFLLRVIFIKNYQKLASLEKLFITFVLSLTISNSLMLLLNFLHIPLERKNLTLGLITISVLTAIIWNRLNRKKTTTVKKHLLLSQKFTLKNPSYRQILIFILLLAFSVFLRSIYLADGIFPKTTDLGHHMYWANYISTKAELPNYSEKFIIGEHLPFAAINIISHIYYLSPFPVIILFLFNIFSLIGVFILTHSLAVIFLKFIKQFHNNKLKLSATDIALWSLFITGILYPISAPQVKFVSGGVIGNIIGNLLIIVTIYSFLKSILLKSNAFASLFFISILSLVYTHHLSSFIFIYSFGAILISFIFLTLIFLKFNLKSFFKLVFTKIKPFFSGAPLLIIALGIFFLWQVRTPSYLNPEAIDVAVGTPTKITRVGFGFSAIIDRVGSWRMLFAGIFAVISLPIFWNTLKNIYSKKINSSTKFQKILTPVTLTNFSLAIAILLAWAIIIFLMSWKPGLLKVDIPSRRIITYLTYPIAIMASFGIAYFFLLLKTNLPKFLFSWLFIFFIGIGIVSGFSQDINLNQRSAKNVSRETMQTYLASIYLANNSANTEMILKDHKFLEGDTWMKLFFMRGYKYPLSRTYNRRYEDKINKRETCTRDMIAIPNSEIGQQCFMKTNTKYVVLKKGFDDAIFLKSPDFQEVYSSSTVRVFQRR